MTATGVELATAYVALSVETRNIGKQVASGFAPVQKQADDAGKKAGGRFSTGMHSGMAGLAGMFTGLMAGIGVKDFIGDSIAEARESQKVGAITANVIKVTGGAAKITAGQVGELATAISNKSGMDDEAIQTGANLLLTFKNVRNEVGSGNDMFNQATQAAVDLSAAGFGSVDGAAKMLGKALNDPLKGISALSRAGVTFTEGQKKQIKGMVAAGDTLGAQKIIMKEVQTQVGGAAAASATAGEKASVAFGNFKETIGTALLPMMDRLSNGFVKLLTQFQTGEGAGGRIKTVFTGIGTAATFLMNHVDAVKAVLAGVISAFVVWKTAVAAKNVVDAVQLTRLKLQTVGTLQNTIVTKAAAAASKVWAAGQWLVNAALSANPIGIVVVAVAALVAAIVLLYKNNETVRRIIDSVWKGVKSAISATVGWFTNTAWPAVRSAISAIGQGFKDLWSGVKTAWNGVKGAIGGVVTWFRDTAWLILKTYIGLYIAIGKALWTAVKAAWKGVQAAISATVSWFRDTAWPILKRVIGFFTSGVKTLWTNLKSYWNGIKTVISTVVNWFRDTAVAIWKREVAGFSNIASNLWRKAIKPAFDGIKAVISGVVSWIRDTGIPIAKRAFDAVGQKARDVWTRVLSPAFSAIKTGVGQVATKFDAARRNIATAWNKLEGIAKKPIHFILDTVINRGLISGFNWLSGKIGGPHVSNVPVPFASGGVLPGYTPGRDVHQFVSPTGGRLALSGGEAIMRPEFTKLVGGKGGVNALNAMARAGRLPFQAFKGGGVLDWIKGKSATAFNWIGDKASAIYKGVTDPKKFLQDRLAKVTGSDMISKIGQGAVGKLVGAAVNKVKGLYKSFEGAFGGAFTGGGAVGSGVARWRGVAMKAMDAAGLPGAYLNLLLKRMNVESGGNPNAINNWDINAKNGVPSQGLMQTIPPTFNAYAGPYRGLGIRNPFANIYAAIKYTLARYGLSGIGRAWGGTAGYAEGGVMPKPLLFDSGGILPTGTSLVHNGTGAPEPLSRVDRGGTTVYMNVSVDDLAKMSKLSDFYEMLDNARVTSRKTLRSGRVSA